MSIVDVELCLIPICLKKKDPPHNCINQTLICSFFQERDGSSLVTREIVGDQCIKLPFPPMILVIKIYGGKKKKTFKAQIEFHLLVPRML